MARIRHKHAVSTACDAIPRAALNAKVAVFLNRDEVELRRRVAAPRGRSGARRRPQRTTPPEAEYLRLATLAGHRAH